MAQFTKMAITASTFRLAASKPLAKITVKDIVEDCGVTRNTFYYYFKDVYDVLEDAFLTETAKVLSSENVYGNWDTLFLSVTDFLFRHKEAILHIYDSTGREELNTYLSKTMNHTINCYVEQQAEGLDADPDDLRLIALFYREAMMGILSEWLRQEMSYDPREVLHRISELFSGQVRTVIETSVRNKRRASVMTKPEGCPKI